VSTIKSTIRPKTIRQIFFYYGFSAKNALKVAVNSKNPSFKQGTLSSGNKADESVMKIKTPTMMNPTHILMTFCVFSDYNSIN